MKLCYYKGDVNNFGDDLNPYILEHLLPDFGDRGGSAYLLFIGTILHDGLAVQLKADDFYQKKKVVIGSGVRFMNAPPKIDETWDIRFFRGPLSSLAMTGKSDLYITDPAYLINETPFIKNTSFTKKHKVSIMPHFLSLDKIDWLKLCNHYELNFIDPSENDVEIVMGKIAESEYLITEAMHGAIVADALRVPWKRFNFFSHFYESDLVSEFKWSDWLYSVGLKHDTFSCKYNKVISLLERRYSPTFFRFIRYKDITSNFDRFLLDDKYQLSDDKLLASNTERLMEELLNL